MIKKNNIFWFHYTFVIVYFIISLFIVTIYYYYYFYYYYFYIIFIIYYFCYFYYYSYILVLLLVLFINSLFRSVLFIFGFSHYALGRSSVALSSNYGPHATAPSDKKRGGYYPRVVCRRLRGVLWCVSSATVHFFLIR